ncbi:MAG: M4 family metallopeptidase [Actinomycetes bacterium]
MPRPARRAVSGLALLTAAAAASVLVTGPAAGAAGAVGTVFSPNPVQSTGDETLTDQKDADVAVPSSAYRDVTLTDLDGSGTLNGTWATIKSATGPAAFSSSGSFRFTRHDDRFEQVMAYYWITQSQRYLRSLGFGTGAFPPANARQQVARINQFGGDNSFFREDGKLTITLGKGGVDDAEDGEVIVHEYGHAVQDAQVPGFGTTLEAGSIGEGFGDYLAVAVSDWVSGVPTLAPEACVADWDSVSYTSGPVHCLRRIDGTKHYPEDIANEVHRDGEIWSSTLYDIRGSVGASTADKIIVNAQFSFAPDTSFRDAALDTVAAAQQFGNRAVTAVRAAFTERGIL